MARVVCVLAALVQPLSGEFVQLIKPYPAGPDQSRHWWIMFARKVSDHITANHTKLRGLSAWTRLADLLGDYVYGARIALSWPLLQSFYDFVVRVNSASEPNHRNITRLVCAEMPKFLDYLFNYAAESGGDVLTETLRIHELAAEALGLSPCCQDLVQRRFQPVLEELAATTKPWHIRMDWKKLWRCMEWPFWTNEHGIIRHGLRGHLWDAVLQYNEVRAWGIVEALTVQLVFMPLCLHRTFASATLCETRREVFFSSYEHCLPTHMRYAVDHLVNAGEMRRAKETFLLARSFPAIPTLNWQSFHAAGMNFVPVASWPWWQTHPDVAKYVHFLEANFETLATERPNVEDHPSLKKDAFPATSRNLSWCAVDLYPFDEDLCSRVPNTCRALASLNWTAQGDIVTRKMAWNIVAPGSRLGGHSAQSLRINIQICVHGCDGAELHLNGSIVQYQVGRALAWQDNWRHEVFNHGSEPRWAFMLSIAHPEFQEAVAHGNGSWAATYKHLRKSESLATNLALLRQATGPYYRN